MNQLVKCRCGRWTDYGLSCTSCKSTVTSYSEEEYEVETTTPEEEEPDEEDKAEEN